VDNSPARRQTAEVPALGRASGTRVPASWHACLHEAAEGQRRVGRRKSASSLFGLQAAVTGREGLATQAAQIGVGQNLKQPG
jgi:hypothetical protein